MVVWIASHRRLDDPKNHDEELAAARPWVFSFSSILLYSFQRLLLLWILWGASTWRASKRQQANHSGGYGGWRCWVVYMSDDDKGSNPHPDVDHVNCFWMCISTFTPKPSHANSNSKPGQVAHANEASIIAHWSLFTVCEFRLSCTCTLYSWGHCFDPHSQLPILLYYHFSTNN